MATKVINLIEDFGPRPYGRYQSEVQRGEEDNTGERFRKEFLEPALRNNEKVKVNLSGYNRYARSFIDEAFGGLISSGAFTLDDLSAHLVVEHLTLPSIETLVWDRIKIAEEARKELG